WRFFSSPASASGGWNVSWPEDAARGLAVLHYEDGLPSDVVAFSPGDRRVLPAAGVDRIDWIVLGRDDAPAPLAVPVAVTAEADFPVSGLSASARTEPGAGLNVRHGTPRPSAGRSRAPDSRLATPQECRTGNRAAAPLLPRSTPPQTIHDF